MTKVIKINLNIINKSEIARKLGVSPQYVSMILNNKRKAHKVREEILRVANQLLFAA